MFRKKLAYALLLALLLVPGTMVLADDRDDRFDLRVRRDVDFDNRHFFNRGFGVSPFIGGVHGFGTFGDPFFNRRFFVPQDRFFFNRQFINDFDNDRRFRFDVRGDRDFDRDFDGHGGSGRG